MSVALVVACGDAPTGPRVENRKEVIMLDPVVARACRYGGTCPNCEPAPCEVNCTEGGGGAGGGGGGTGDGDGGTGEETATDEFRELDPNDLRPDCVKDADGYCVTRLPSAEEWEQLGQVIDALREDIHECRQAKRILQGNFAQGREGGRFRFWDGKDLNKARTRQRFGFISSDQGGRVINYDGYYAVQDRGLVVHEALHTYLNNINSPLQGQANEDWVAEMEVVCEQ